MTTLSRLSRLFCTACATSLVTSLVFGILLLNTGCQVEPQDPRLILNNQGSLPSSLLALANPNPNSRQGLAGFQISKTSQPGRVGVAVIDNGVDYLHQDLASQIRFTVRDGQVVGAGFDAMGGDFAAHSNLVNPALFALTAEKVEFGQLTKIQGDPLLWLNQVQSEFAQLLKQALVSDPVLSTGLIGAKVSFLKPESMSVFVLGMPAYLKWWQLTASKIFKRNKEEGKLLTFQEQNRDALYKEYGKFSVDSFIQEPWVLSLGGSPLEFSNRLLLRYVHLDRFIGVLTTVFNNLNVKHGILARLENYHTYRNAINTILTSTDPTNRANSLTQAWLYANNFTVASPILEALFNLCQAFPRDVKAQLQSASLNNDQRWQLFRSTILKNILSVVTLAKRQLELEPMNAQDKKDLEKSISNPGVFLQMMDEIMLERPQLKRYLACQKDLLVAAQNDPELSKFVEARKHPYLSQNSESESHGTHVSGIIAKQNPSIDIVPVRVVTASNPPLPQQVRVLRENFERGFSVWIANQSVAAGLGNSKLAGFVFGHPLSQAQLVAGMKAYLDAEFLNNYLDFTFFDQIKQAIQYVGSQKIKVANMSLGTTFDKAVLSPDKKDHEALVKNFYTFVLYEYFKFDVALTVQNFAKNTLFVIAAGNDGAWLDGNSKSGLPCDLSSPVLAHITDLPNNQIKNILCVGSMDDTNLLSSFTNIPLTQVPYVLSYGEAILSPVKTTDCSGSMAQFLNQTGQIKDLPPLEVAMDNVKYDDILKSSGYWETDPFNPDTEKERSAAADSLSNAISANFYIAGAMTQHRCMKIDKTNMARMSGTSMATPAVAGFVAKQVIKKMAHSQMTRSLTDDQIYDLPEFAPEKLISEITSASPAFGGSSLIKDVKMIPEIMKWQPHPSRLNRMVGVRASELIRSR